MSDIMKQCRGARGRAILRSQVGISQSIQDARHQVQRAETVSKARVLSALIGIQTQTKLLDAAQTLKLSRVDQTDHQLLLGGVVTQSDDVVNRIAVNSLRHLST